ncbi:T9SS type A sorting domain-containing protein [Dyadobacter sp.]|uniref:T9SS type A sorting domain-containing protein n=1 Tax=Dyadobacter sp. TaxID=1914288 RepID=UPI003F71B0D1
MKAITRILALSILTSTSLYAQFSSGNQFFIGANTTVSIHGLVLRPTFNNTVWTNKVITRSPDAIIGDPTPSINQVHEFNEPTGFSGLVGLTYFVGNLNGNTEDDLQIAYFNPDEKYVTTTGSTVDKTLHMVSRNFTGFNNSFLRITATNANSVLPVTLVSFKAFAEGRQAHLAWSTSDETNSDYFEVQRSFGGKDWKAIGKVKATGESKIERTYTFEDNAPLSGQNLYRLKMVDMDGTYTHSKIAVLDFGSNMLVSVYPNPLTEKLLIQIDDWNNIKSVELVTKQGNIIPMNTSKAGSEPGTREYDFRKYPVGTYYIKVTRQDGGIKTQQIVKM